MYCLNCGSENELDAKFCADCGTSIENSESPDNDNISKVTKPKWFNYIWVILNNLITIGVILAIYSSAYDSFEIIVVSILIIIYLNIKSSSMISMNFALSTGFNNHDEFAKIKKLLQKKVNESDDEEFENIEYTKAKEMFDKAKTKMYINGCFIYVIYIITLWNLFDSL